MVTIDYFDGRKTIKLEASEDVAKWYTEAVREEWRIDKQIKRHEIVTDFIRTKGVDDCLLADLIFADPLKEIVEREQREEGKSKLCAAIKTLTPEQLKLVEILRKGKSISEIARYFGVSKSAVSNMRTRIQEKIKKLLH